MKVLFFTLSILTLMIFFNYQFYQQLSQNSVFPLPLKKEILLQKELAKNRFSKKKNSKRIEKPPKIEKKEGPINQLHTELSKLDSRKRFQILEDLFLLHYENKIEDVSKEDLLCCRDLLLSEHYTIDFLKPDHNEGPEFELHFHHDEKKNQLLEKIIKGKIEDPHYLPLRLWMSIKKDEKTLCIIVSQNTAPYFQQISSKKGSYIQEISQIKFKTGRKSTKKQH